MQKSDNPSQLVGLTPLEATYSKKPDSMKDIHGELWPLTGLALQMGYLIAIPLVVFAIAGRFIDKIFASSPLFFLISVLVAIVLSTILVYRKTTALLRDTEKKED